MNFGSDETASAAEFCRCAVKSSKRRGRFREAALFFQSCFCFRRRKHCLSSDFNVDQFRDEA
ncbi:hypothetical protein GCWU000341_00440 [Oribacterium sp. oral taxon 078 str. F0262]|nr:hypothetical protein GCWU000341_00440 [Oribacterium sp. oral taxon 078 str. F0262]